MIRRALMREEPLRRAVLLATVAGVPLLFMPGFTLDPFNVPKLALLLTGVGVTLLLRAVGVAAGASPPTGISSAAMLTLVLIAPLTIAWLFASPYRGWALWGDYERYGGLIPQLVLGGLALLIADAFRGRGQDILSALISAGVVVGTYTILQRFRLDPFVWSGSQNGSTLGNPNYSGSFLAICLPIAVWGARSLKGRRKDVALLGIGPILAGLLFSSSQGPWAAGLVGVLALVAVSATRRWMRVSAAAAALSIAAGIVLAVWFSLTPSGESLLGPTVRDRGYAAAAALSMSGEYPFLGRGPDAFAVEGIRYRTPEQAVDAIATISDPHSTLLYYLTSAGIFGAGAFIGVAVWLLKGGNRRNSDSLATPLIACIAAYLTATLVAHDQLSLRVAFWATLGLLAVDPLRRTERRRLISGRWTVLPTVVVSIALLIAATNLVEADRDALLGSRAALDNEPSAALPSLSSSLEFDPTLEHRKVFGQRVGELATRRGSEAAHLYRLSSEAFTYLDDFPEVDGLVRAARLAFAWGIKVDRSHLEEALHLFSEARRYDKYHPVLAAETADVMLELGRVGQASSLLTSLRDDEIPFYFYWRMLAETHALQNEYDAAYAAMRRAIELLGESPLADEYRDHLRHLVRTGEFVDDLP